MLVLFLLQGAALPGIAGGKLRLESSADAMGSTYSLIIYGEDRVKMEAAAAHAFNEARRLDDLLSNYKPSSEWSRLNREAANRPVIASEELYTLLAACLNYSAHTDGAFDISVGPLMQTWGFFKGSGYLPAPSQIESARAHTGYRHVVLNPADRTVAFTEPGVSLDPGGIGKGYAVDRMADVLKKNGIASAFISAGGSSIYGLGVPPGERGWSVALRDPRNSTRRAAEITLKDESLSTSGSFEKFFVAEGKTFSHIMDPRTGYPAQGTLSVSVTAPRTLDSEAWAKPYFINGRQWTASHKPRDQRVFYCEDKVNQPCAWLQ